TGLRLQLSRQPVRDTPERTRSAARPKITHHALPELHRPASSHTFCGYSEGQSADHLSLREAPGSLRTIPENQQGAPKTAVRHETHRGRTSRARPFRAPMLLPGWTPRDFLHRYALVANAGTTPFSGTSLLSLHADPDDTKPPGFHSHPPPEYTRVDSQPREPAADEFRPHGRAVRLRASGRDRPIP